MNFPVYFSRSGNPDTARAGSIASSSVAPPDAPVLTLVSYTGNTITVSWPAVSGATSYKIYKDGVLVDAAATSPYAVTGLTANTSYAITVKAVNAGGDSAASNTITQTTSPYPTLSDPTKQLALIDFDRRSYSDEGVTPAVAGDPIKLVKLVSGWDLLSIGGYARQNTLSLRPTLRSDGSQGDGITSYILTPAAISLTGDFTLYDVSYRGSNSDILVLIGSAPDRVVLWSDGTAYVQPAGSTVGTYTDSQTGLQIRRLSRSGTSLKYKRNGAAEQTVTTSATLLADRIGQFSASYYDSSGVRRRQQWYASSYIAGGSADDLAIIAAIQALYPTVAGP